MKHILLLGALLFSFASAGFDFGECSGSGTFEQEIEYYNGNYENAVIVGTIPAGIQGLYVELISSRDVDIRLYGQNEDKIVHWPYGILNSSSIETQPYLGVDITYSGYSGVDGKKGHEFINVDGTTPTAMTMKAFGFSAGYATVNYTWTGKENCEASENGTGHFEQEIGYRTISLVGTIPANIKNLEVNLTSSRDIDIQLYAQDGTAIIQWPNGLLNGSRVQEIDFHGMHIEWSGYNGVGGYKGHEYIKLSGITTEILTMKVYGYQSGYADVDYQWGSLDSNQTDTTAPVITLLGNTTVTVTQGDAYVDAGATATDNVDGDLTASIVVVNPVDTSIVGTYVVTYNVSDAAGNAAQEVNRTIEVVEPADTVAPVISLLGDSNVTLIQGETYLDAGAIASDNKDGNITSSIVINNPVDTTTIGEYIITYNVNDAAGNSAVEVQRHVWVEAPADTTAPIITLLGNTTVTVTQGDAYVDAGATATDNVDGDLTASIVVVNPVDTSIVGTYVVTYNVSDAAGNAAQEVNRTVVVEASDVTTKIQPLLIVRITFNDVNFTNDASTWSNKIYPISTGTLNDYYNEISYGTFRFQAVTESDTMVDDGVITVHLNKNHPNPGTDAVSFMDEMKDALALADSSINFAQYDTNSNGAISRDELQIMFLVAGGESATGTSPGIWAHAWCMYGGNAVAPTYDGVKLMNCADNGGYSIFGERHSTHDATMGIMAHELGHAKFNLPDLYDTDGGSEGIGNFGLMGSGAWGYKPGDTAGGQTPVHMTGWSKIQSGFVVPEVINGTVNGLDLFATSSSDYKLYQLRTGNNGEYFLIENRGASGYDMGLTTLVGTSNFTGGLSILHIDDNQVGNTDENHKLVDVEEANDAGLDAQTNRGHINNLYFTGNADSFSDTTTPNSKRYDGISSGVSVTNISQSASVMTADVIVQ